MLQFIRPTLGYSFWNEELKRTLPTNDIEMVRFQFPALDCTNDFSFAD